MTMNTVVLVHFFSEFRSFSLVEASPITVAALLWRRSTWMHWSF